MTKKLKRGTKVIIAPDSPYTRMNKSFDGNTGVVQKQFKIKAKQFYGEYIKVKLDKKVDGFEIVVVAANTVRRVI